MHNHLEISEIHPHFESVHFDQRFDEGYHSHDDHVPHNSHGLPLHDFFCHDDDYFDHHNLTPKVMQRLLVIKLGATFCYHPPMYEELSRKS